MKKMDKNKFNSAVLELIKYMEHDEYLKGLSYQELKSILIATGRTLSKHMGAVTLQEIYTLGRKIPEDIAEQRDLSDRSHGFYV